MGPISSKSHLQCLFCALLLIVSNAALDAAPGSLDHSSAKAISRSSAQTIATDELRRLAPSSNPLFVRAKERELNVALRSIQAFARSNADARRLVQGVLTPRIVGGTRARRWENPFQVALLYAPEPDNYNAQFCGGSVLSSKYIITAGHCVEGAALADVQILTGTRKLDGTGTRLAARQIWIHPQYDTLSLDYDIAIVEVDAGSLSLPVELPAAEPATGDQMLVTGWGRLTESGARPVDLMAVRVPVFNRAVCNGPTSYNGLITARMFCAGLPTGGQDSCQGDSGGPVSGGVGNSELMGVVSWGFGCAQPNLPGVYAKLADPGIRNFINWFAPAPLFLRRRRSSGVAVSGYGTASAVSVTVNSSPRKVWGSRKYADVQATAGAYCRGLGFASAMSWKSGACGDGRGSYLRFNPGASQWESSPAGNANNRGGYCRYPLLTSVQCSPDVRVTVAMSGKRNNRGVGSLSCGGRSCSIRGNRPRGRSCTVLCPVGSTVTLDCVANNPRRTVSEAAFTRNGSGRQTVISNKLPISGTCSFTD